VLCKYNKTRNVTNELQLAVIQTGFRLFVFFFSFTLKVILCFEAITESTVHYNRMVRYTDGVKQFSSAMTPV